jgi:aspartyl-tRNA(Asn)/glutamyl-tRNA(Gln) amidotransferase subunit C
MSLTEKDVIKIAKLARIGLSDDEKKIFVKELSNILDMVEQLQEVNTDQVPQMKSVSTDPLPRRRDEIKDGNIAEDIVRNAPLSEYNCFVVPKVVE